MLVKNSPMKLLLLISIVSFSSINQAEELSLTKLWEMDGLSTPEAVVYDAQTNSLYVSNINGSPFEKDGNGFISKVSLEGDIEVLKWSVGLSAPKGLAIHGDNLYVADINELVEISLKDGEIKRRFYEAGAIFFNDVISAENGTIYVADSATNTIHQLDENGFSEWFKSVDLKSPNGLLIEKDRMLVTAWGSDEEPNTFPGQVLSISLQDKSITVIGDKQSEGNLDGIKKNTNGDYFITEWTIGKLLLLNKSGETTTLLTLGKGMADLDYIESKQTLVLPMLMTNKLIAYSIH
jgi:sugar lactone lactonase YvrE